MRKLMVMVAMATMICAQGVASSLVSPVAADSLSTGQNDSKLGRKSQTQSVVGGVLGALLGKGNAQRTNTNAESCQKDSDTLDNVKGKGALGGALGDALGSLFGNIASSKLTAEKITGTWNYTGSKCVLESEDIMKKAGSELLVAPLEKKLNSGLERIGMTPGSYTFTFNEDGSFTSNMSGRTLKGTYVLKPEEKKITMNYLGGLVHTTMDVVVMNGKMGLLYDSDKLLTFASAVASISKSTAMKGLKSILESYDGMKVGLEFKR